MRYEPGLKSLPPAVEYLLSMLWMRECRISPGPEMPQSTSISGDTTTREATTSPCSGGKYQVFAAGIAKQLAARVGGAAKFQSPTRQTVLYDDVVGSNFFNDLMRFAVDHGIFEALTQDNPITTAHNIGTYAAKSSDGRTNTFKVPGGLMRDERHNRIREIFLGKDGLLPFYEERQRLRDEIAEREMAEEEGRPTAIDFNGATHNHLQMQ